MRDIAARELKGHNILAVERFQDNTRWMLELVFSIPVPPTAVLVMRCGCFSQRTGIRPPLPASSAGKSKSSGTPV